jgi:hypothetical protein
MPIECPRCLLTNPDTVLLCECGYDFTPHFQRSPFRKGDPARKGRRTLFKRQMHKGSFFLGIALLWMGLSVGELYRIRIELPRRPMTELALSSLMVGLTDLLGALVIGTIGWACVWIAMSSHGHAANLCPRRTTFVVTSAASVILFLIRTIEPGILIQHVIEGLAIVALAAFSYYAGTRQWLGRW